MEMSCKEKEMRRRSSSPGTEELKRSGSSGSSANDEATTTIIAGNSATPAALKSALDAADQGKTNNCSFYEATVDPEILFTQVQGDSDGNRLYTVKVKQDISGRPPEMPRGPDGTDDHVVGH